MILKEIYVTRLVDKNRDKFKRVEKRICIEKNRAEIIDQIGHASLVQRVQGSCL